MTQTKKKHSKRLLSLFLALVMVIGMLPSYTITAHAEASNNVVIAWNDTDNDGVIDNGETTYTNLTTALNAGGTVKLTGDERIYVSISTDDQYINLKNTTVTLDLNGRYLSFDSFTTQKGIYLSGSAKLTITDSGSGGVVDVSSMVNKFDISDTAQLIITGGDWDTNVNGIASGSIRDSASVTITGGTFDFDPTAYIPDDYKVVRLGLSEKYEVTPIDISEVVAWIDADGDGSIDSGERMFAALQDALNVGGNLKLNCNITSLESDVFNVFSNTAIDLNGYNITATATSNATMLFLINSGSLTFRDSKGGGYVDGRAREFIVNGHGVTSIESGIYYAASDKPFYGSGERRLTGGTYNFNPDVNYDTDGYVAVQEEDMWVIYPTPDNCTVSIGGIYYYTGSQIIPKSVTVKDSDGTLLTEGKDYTLSYANNTDVGTAKVIVTFIKDYRGTKTAEFVIHSFVVSDSTEGSIQLPSAGDTVTVTLTALVDGTTDVSADTTWTLLGNYPGISIDGNIVTIDSTASKGNVEVKGTYDGTEDTLSFTLAINALPDVTISEDVIYNGSEQKPVVSIDGLTEGEDYFITYKRGESETTDFTNVGTITVIITGKGSYDGIVEKTYTIHRKTIAENDVTVPNEVTYSGSEQKPVVSISGLTEGQDYTVTYKRGEETTTDFTKVGTITVTVEGIGNFDGTISKTYTIDHAVIDEDDVLLPVKEVNWDGQNHKPTVTVSGVNSTTLVENVDYSIAYTRAGTETDDFTLCGTITVTVTAEGNYMGTVVKTFVVNHTYDENEVCKGCGLGYYYIKYTWNESTESLSSETINATNYTFVTSDSTQWTDGWYVVQDSVTVSSRITVTGDVHLLLMDGAELTATKGIQVAAGHSLTIYGQIKGSGKLTIPTTDNSQAGIGGNEAEGAGTINIHGGDIAVTAKDTAIGSAYKGSGGTVTIYHGAVRANVASKCNGSGIGGGYMSTGGSVTIYGGNITATAGGNCAGIGGKDGFLVTIRGGTIIANGGSGSAGIGSHYCGIEGAVVITGGNIKASAGSSVASGHANRYPQAIGVGAYWSTKTQVSVTDGKENSVALNAITLEGASASTPVTAINGVSYGLNDVKTLDKLYFYFPADTAATSITAGETEYICNRNLTYYPEHSYIEATCTTAKTCEFCGVTEGEALGHSTYVNGMCTVCGLDENGVYHIKTADQLMVFAAVVNLGTTNANAILEADIDLTDYYATYGNVMIGTSSAKYSGTFDGNGKTLTVNLNSTEQYVAPFRYISGATIQNLIVNGTIMTSEKFTGGLVGFSEGDSKIEKCMVGVNITSTKSDDGTHGGLVANVNAGTMIINNCAFVGSISGSSTTSCGGFVGWSNGTTTISNSYMAGNFTTKPDGCYTFGRNASKITVTDSYYLTAYGDVNSGATQKSEEEFASGEVTYLLNGSTSEGDLVWGQLIGTDKFPVIGGEVVYYDENKTPSYYNILHEHEWKYEADDTNSDNVNDKITATCKAEDCTNTNGGTVMISAPADRTYTGSAINAVVTNDLTTGDTVTVVYAPADKLTLGEPVNVGEYTATITLGEGDNKAKISVTYEITKAVITDISATINSVTAPVAGQAPDTAVDNGTGYTAEIKWNTIAEKYGYNTEYTATITLTPDANHTFDEVSAEGWDVSVDSESGVATLTRTYKTAKAKITSITAPENKELDGIYTDVNDLIKILDQTITITAEDGTTSLDITWNCSDYSASPNKVNTFTWTAEAGDLDANGNALTGTITVTNGNAIGVVITGTDTDITYNGNKYNVSGMFDIDENAGTATYSIVSGGTGAGTLDDGTLTITKAGTIIIQVDTAATGIYAAGTAQATLTVEKGTGSGTVTIEGWTYGNGEKSPVPTSATNGTTNVTYKYAGTGDTVYAESETAPTAAGTYKVTAAFAETDLYNACTGDATFTIAKRPVTATITVTDKDYDGNSTATVKEIVINNKVDNDDVTAANGTATFENATAGKNKAVEFTGWTLTGDDAANYILSAQPVDAEATINKIALTITADNHTITYGDAPANNGVSYDGFVNGETVGVLGGTLEYTYSYAQFDDIGNEFTITPSGLTSANYDITFVSGKLTVNQKKLGIDWGTTTFTYDGNEKLPAATATGTVNGDVISLTVAGAQTNASTETYTATVTGIAGDKAGNYKLPADVTTAFTIKNASQDAPNVEAGNETVDGANDGKISGVDSTMEWRAEGETSYTAIENNATELAGLTDGTYYVRYAAKDNYDASADTIVVIGVGNKLTVTIPQVQTGYTLTVDVDELSWNGSVTLTFEIAEGYSKTDAFAVKVNGSAVKLGTDGKYTISNVQSNVVITVEGVADITAPEAAIKIGDNFWKTLLNNITFGKFFKETQTVTITAEDVNTGSGLNKIYYYLATEEVSDFASVTWTEYTDAFNINPDNEYIIYAKATDHAGNAVTISSTGLVLDATKPAITGIENGGTYYGDTTITATDKYLDTVKVDGEKVELGTDGKYTIEADNAEHVVTVTDKAENVTEYKITVYKIYTVTYVADGKTVAEIQVNHGHDVEIVPAIPVKEGYTQTAPAWDKDGKNITANTEITAVYTINKYTVKYVADGVTVDTQTVEHGGNATAPSIPVKEGYTQKAPVWEKDGKNITEDTEITAVYTINKYTVKYVADGETVDTQTVEHGGNATAPSIPVKEGYTQKAPAWDKDGKNITADTEITAVYTINKYTVKYVADGVTVDTQTVEHGSDAVVPAVPVKEGYDQTAGQWSHNGKNITADTEITAVYTINKYTVKYVADGVTVDTQTVEHGSDAVVPAVPVKEGYDQTAGQWSHNGKNITADTTINAVYTINGYTITVPEIQTGYTLTVDKTYVEWGSDAVLTFALADGYSKVDGTFAVKVNGSVVELEADGTYTIAGIKSNIAITVEGVADITAPEATIKIGDNFWNTLLNNITFGKFFKETQKVEITAKDVNTGSGLNKIYYYLATEEVSDFTSVTWTEYTGSFNIEPNTEVIIYAWAEDNAGNDKYISSTGLVLDSIAPVINGITSGTTYYGTTGYTVSDTYEVTVTDNGTAVILVDAKGTITADGKEHTITVTDEAGNSSEVTVTVKTVEDIDDSITVDDSNVTAEDKDDIQSVIDSIDNILNDESSDLTDEEKEELEDLRDKAQDLIDKIAETEAAVEDVITDADGFKSDEVTSDDKEEIEDLIKEIEDLIASDNTTDEQKADLEDAKEALEDRVQEIEDAAQDLEDAKAPVKDITSDNVTADDSDELAKAKETLEELKEDSTYTEEEKAEIQAEIERITELEEKIAEVEKEVSDLKETVEGYDKDTVTSKDKDVLEELIEDAKALLETDNLTDEQKETVEDIKADAEELLKEIEDAASDITTEDIKEVEDITSDNVKLEDKENLEEALEDLKEALEDNAGNYTDEEKAAIEEDIARIEDALESIEKVEDVIDQITELPNADDVDTDDEDTVADVQEIVDAYDKLTDHEKSLIDEELISKLEDVQDKLSDYKIIVGADGSYTKGSKDGLEFTANGAFAKFTGIKVDGNEVAEDHYTAKAGSTVLTLKASYLETLTTGKHELTVVYTDGEASCDFTIKAKAVADTTGTESTSTSPGTGDGANLALWFTVMLLSGLGVAGGVFKKRKKYRA